MVFFVIGVAMLVLIIALFWLKDQLRSPRLARIAYSEPIARLAVVGAALTVVGSLMMIARFFDG
ncbi:MAG TPA: hypothetical protein VKB27_19745 [Gammaproteobacteria bacterium]|nr:hypothetical protein [Gammaproteobacteria bacterium]